jgi:hypothetical protein
LVPDAISVARVSSPLSSDTSTVKSTGGWAFPWTYFRSLSFCQVVGDDARADLYKLLLRLGERIRKIAFDIELCFEFLVHVDGDHDFRLHHGRSREVARICGHILYDYYLTTTGRGAAEPPGDGKSSVGGKASGVRSDNEVPSVRRIDLVEASPVVARHLFVQPLGHLLH